MSSILLICIAIPLVALSLFHAAAFMLAVSAVVNLVICLPRGRQCGFPGAALTRHAKLAVPALAVIVADAGLLWIASGAPSA